jgi:predicted PurR-regulated permease PerM
VTELFSPAQRRVLAAATTLAALGVILLLIVFGIQQFARLLALFTPMLWPLATAGILALLLQPLVNAMEVRLRFSRIASVILLYGMVILISAALIIVLVPLLYGQLQELFVKLPMIWDSLVAFVQERVPAWLANLDARFPDKDVSNSVKEWLQHLEGAVIKILPTPASIGSQVLGVFGAIVGLAIIPVYLFFFLQTSLDPTKNLGEHLPFLRDEHREDVVFLVREFISVIVSFFRGQLLIGIIMGVLFAIGFTFGGLKFGLLIGLAMGLLNIIPYLGSIIGLAIAIPTAFFQPEGGLTTALIVIGVFTAVQMIEGYYLTPKIMGDRTGLHPVVIIIAIFFWGIALGGILGMVLAIPLTAFFVTAWRLAKKKYIRPFT